jgi:hypothetical protein
MYGVSKLEYFNAYDIPAETWLNKGICYHYLGMYEDIGRYDKALKLEYILASTLYVKGLALSGQVYDTKFQDKEKYLHGLNEIRRLMGEKFAGGRIGESQYGILNNKISEYEGRT